MFLRGILNLTILVVLFLFRGVFTFQFNIALGIFGIYHNKLSKN